MVQFDTVAFMISLYEIDCLIEEKEALACDQFNEKKNEFINEELIKQKLPHCYLNLKNIFFKTAFDMLPFY